MKVKELIEHLKKMKDQEREITVVVNDYYSNGRSYGIILGRDVNDAYGDIGMNYDRAWITVSLNDDGVGVHPKITYRKENVKS